MGLDNLPQKIKDEILGNGNDKDSYYDRKDNEVHVTELLYCLTKSYYSRKFPITPTLEQAFWLYRGNLLDKAWTELFRDNQIRCTHRVPKFPVTIVGKLDFINDEGELCDLKTTKSTFFIEKEGQAKDEHKKQVQFYCYCNAIDKARVYYMDFGTVVDFPVEIGDATLLIKELEEKATLLYNSLVNNVAPPIDIPEEKKWLCISKNNQCPYYEKCYPVKTLKDWEEKWIAFSPIVKSKKKERV